MSTSANPLRLIPISLACALFQSCITAVPPTASPTGPAETRSTASTPPVATVSPSISPLEAAELVDFIAMKRIGSIPFTTVFLKDKFSISPVREYIFNSMGALDSWLSQNLVTPTDRRLIESIDMYRETGLLKLFGRQLNLLRCEIFSVENKNSRLLIHTVRWTIPPGNGLAEVGSPAHYISIPKTNLPIVFVETIDCPEDLMPKGMIWPQETYE
ncbi:MAG: hypothetical protein JWM80_5366 [Cyanobacteria bacterium RYN_339]|nr:hypothetical protein [Cyanobacteria bacterium RYN_339]